MAVTLPAAVCRRYPRLSRFNSPYTAHDRGCAVDLYPDDPANDAPSPVAGEVLATRTVDAPPKPYAADHDHLVVVDLAPDSPGAADADIARILHVDPAVEPRDRVAVGDSLGRLVRSGFFAPWVANHVHLGFRGDDADPFRASGSLHVELSADLDVRPVEWDGTGTVVETGETYVVLDEPAHPAPGECFAGLAAADGTVLDGGLVHYTGGGALASDGGDAPAAVPADGPLSLLGQRVGTATDGVVEWVDVALRANGDPITGLSLFLGRDRLGTKLVCPDHEFAVGDELAVAVEPTDEPVRLG
jgi:hypothetical protein